ncbi:mitochondrial import inner membrane translocase subunit Tim10 isoform X2 [Megalobrama amblycephala]|uniref:mitochondrial import inner membrane translocase subunit Tim10 isoform X2 n=1 Tax=Megalobrama amblycephala TaxID=75352 RepID=UPI00201429FA|nr:mitochondrial import inner membrane translocase subunit Tim10 isoform X2 [Megalobrama amblycephala]
MWKYQHPDFALFLLGELQKQQQGSIFCDTLLQTEGVCVPAHSCVLAALSPIFSRILSMSPAPQAGQNRLLSLEAVGSHALLKLVGFLYTGGMEIESQSEHEEIMAAAHRLGLRNLFEKKRVWVGKGVMDVGRCWKETGVQTEDNMKSQESEIVSEPLKTQSTVSSVQPCGLLEPDLQLFDEANPTRGFNLISNVTVPSLADMTEASVSNHHKTKAKKRWKMAKRESQLQKLTQQQNQIKILNVEGNKSNQTGVVERSKTVSGKDFQKLLEADNGQKNTTAEQKEAKLDQLKVKIKLRRMSGAFWESNLLVSVQGESETKPEEVKECGPRTQSFPSNVLRGQSLETLTPPTDLPVSPSNSSTHASSDKCLHTPHHISVSSPLEIPTLSSSPPQADESDEHIAMLLEDMFMMGLNILPLDQLGPLQEQKGGQMGAEASTQVQSCEPDQRESDVSKTATLVGSPGQRDHNQSRSNTVKLLTQLPKQDHLNKVQNLATVSRNSTPSLTEGLILTPKATAVPDSVVEGEMPSLVMTSIPDDRPDFNLQKCLSPLESEKGDSDVPSKQSHRQDSETQNFPLWLSESPLILDFPLRSMIDSPCPRPQRDLNACQNQSCLGPAEMQELKTSFSHNDLISGSSSNIAQPDVSDASEHPKQRKTRKRRRTAQKSKVKGYTKCQNLENEDQVQPIISECDEPHCGNIKPSNTYGVSTRITRRVAAGMKRRREISSPLSKKMPTLNTTSKQCEHVDEHVVLPKPTRTRVVKRRRGRPPKPKTTPVDPMCNNAKKLPTSGQDDCEEEETKTDNEIEHGKKQEPNIQPEKDSTEMEEIDVNSNFAQETPNSRLKFAGQTKGPSILDQIFHQALPRVGSPACRSSLNIDQQLTSRLRNTSFSLQKFQGGKSEDVNSKLVMNSSEQINEGICGEKKKAETSMLINGKEDVALSDNQSRSPLSCGDMPDNVKCSVKHGDFSIEENSTRSATVLQNSDLESEIGTDIQDDTTKIYVLLTSEEDIMEDMMTSVEDIDDADHDLSPTKMDCVVATNELIVMEGVEMNFCLNPDSAQAEDLGDEQNSEATVFNECSVEMTSESENVDTQDIGWVADCMKNNEKEDLGRNEEDQIIKENMAAEETEVLSAHEFVEENALLDLNEGCWETNSGLDDDGIDVEEAQYSGEMIDERILLVEEELSQGHIASSKIADDPSKGACPQEISTDAPSEGSNLSSPNVCSEDVSMVLSAEADSESKEDCHLDEEDIEVDVLGESVEEFPLGLLAARQAVILPIEDLLDQEDELDTTEEEENDQCMSQEVCSTSLQGSRTFKRGSCVFGPLCRQVLGLA